MFVSSASQSTSLCMHQLHVCASRKKHTVTHIHTSKQTNKQLIQKNKTKYRVNKKKIKQQKEPKKKNPLVIMISYVIFFIKCGYYIIVIQTYEIMSWVRFDQCADNFF